MKLPSLSITTKHLERHLYKLCPFPHFPLFPPSTTIWLLFIISLKFLLKITYNLHVSRANGPLLVLMLTHFPAAPLLSLFFRKHSAGFHEVFTSWFSSCLSGSPFSLLFRIILLYSKSVPGLLFWAHLQSLGSLIHAMVSMTPRCWWLTRGIFPAQTSQTSCLRWFKGFSSTAGLRLSSWCLPWSLVLPHYILSQEMVPPSTTQNWEPRTYPQ